MSELKVYHCNEWHNKYTEFYLKSEADKVLLHHARKRCLAMANACDLDDLYSNLKMSFVVAKAEQPNARAGAMRGRDSPHDGLRGKRDVVRKWRKTVRDG